MPANVRRVSYSTVLVATFLAVPVATGATGDLDPSWGNGGKVVIAFNLGGNNSDRLSDLVTLPDGSTVAAGTVQTGTTDSDFGVVKLDPDGQIDPSFGTNGSTVVPFNLGGDLIDYVSAAALQSDGKIVIAGAAQWTATDWDMAVVRLHPNGALDSSFAGTGKLTVPFDLGGGLFDEALDVVIQPDGRILLIGGAELATGNDCTVVRLLSNGNLDGSFGTGGKAVISPDLGGGLWDICFAGDVQDDGRIVLSGMAETAGDRKMIAIRLTSSGGLDSTFDGDGLSVVDFQSGGDERAGELVLVGGKVVLGGKIDDGSGIARLNQNGSLDTSFSGDGKLEFAPSGNDDFLTHLDALPSGEIVAFGYGQPTGVNYDFFVAQLRDDGSFDPGFGSGGTSWVPFDLGGSNHDRVSSGRVRGDGSMMVGGRVSVSDSDFALALLQGPFIFSDDFESGDLSAWSTVVP